MDLTHPHALVLAFDVEKLGTFSYHSVIEVGASVVDCFASGFKQRDRYSYSEYRSEESEKAFFVDEDRCMKEFWDKNKDVLEAIERDTDKSITVESSRTLMTIGLVSFIKTWEILAAREGKRLWITTDNKAFDVPTVNDLIEKYVPNQMPLPYNTVTSAYGPLFETHSMQWGILLMACGTKYVDQHKGMTRALEENFEVPPSDIKHDHRAANDAYTIAREFQVCLSIARGEIKRKLPRDVPLL